MVAWLLTATARPVGWPRRRLDLSVGLVMLVSSARLYVGWDWPSEIVASIAARGAVGGRLRRRLAHPRPGTGGRFAVRAVRHGVRHSPVSTGPG